MVGEGTEAPSMAEIGPATVGGDLAREWADAWKRTVGFPARWNFFGHGFGAPNIQNFGQ